AVPTHASASLATALRPRGARTRTLASRSLPTRPTHRAPPRLTTPGAAAGAASATPGCRVAPALPRPARAPTRWPAASAATRGIHTQRLARLPRVTNPLGPRSVDLSSNSSEVDLSRRRPPHHVACRYLSRRVRPPHFSPPPGPSHPEANASHGAVAPDHHRNPVDANA